MAEETTPNNTGDETPTKPSGQAPAGETAGENAPPSTVDQQAPSIVSENLRSTSEPESTSIPTANAPDPTTANPEVNPDAAAEKGSQAVSSPDESESAEQPEAKKAAASPKGDKPAAKAAKPAAAKAEGDKPAAAKAAKKEKGPTVEDKPFAEFIQQDYLPAIKNALAQQGVKDLELTFEKQKLPIPGYDQTDACWQIIGRWQNGGQRQFNLYFPQENIQGQRAFSCNDGPHPSTLESFLIDERKVSLDLMVYGLVQRLNGQKWLVRN